MSRFGLINRSWHLFDGKNQPVGRLANKISLLLQGKYKPTYKKNIDDGDYVVVINVDKIRFTGRKMDKKIYYSHSGYPGGLKASTAGRMLRLQPEKVLENAVKGMLPRNKTRKIRMKRLKLYKDVEHPHAQINSVKEKIYDKEHHLSIFPEYACPEVELGFQLPDEEIPTEFNLDKDDAHNKGALPQPFESLGKQDL